MELKRKITKKNSIERKKLKNIILKKFKEKKGPAQQVNLETPNPIPCLSQV